MKTPYIIPYFCRRANKCNPIADIRNTSKKHPQRTNSIPLSPYLPSYRRKPEKKKTPQPRPVFAPAVLRLRKDAKALAVVLQGGARRDDDEVVALFVDPLLRPQRRGPWALGESEARGKGRKAVLSAKEKS